MAAGYSGRLSGHLFVPVSRTQSSWDGLVATSPNGAFHRAELCLDVKLGLTFSLGHNLWLGLHGHADADALVWLSPQIEEVNRL
jgi:hypothetical protein